MSYCIILYKYGKHTRNFWADANTESEIRTVSYGPSFSPSICAMRASRLRDKSIGKKTRMRNFTYIMDRLSLLCV